MGVKVGHGPYSYRKSAIVKDEYAGLQTLRSESGLGRQILLQPRGVSEQAL